MTTLTLSAQTINQIIISLNEKDIENAYRQYLSRKISDIKWTSPFKCDGFGESENHKLRVLCEFKEDLGLTNKLSQVKVLSQAIYYIKKFEISGQKLPTTVLVGDRNECFVIHTNDLFKYLSLDLDWSSPASEAYRNTELVSQMMDDENINPHIFSIYQLEDCIKKLKDLSAGVVRLIPITPRNITEVFSYFEKNVLAKNNLNTNELANLFTQILINPEDNYLHPVSKRKTIVTKSFKDVPLKSREAFKSFFSHFSNDYTPKQKEQLTEVVDRLIKDVTRRKQGEFFTPTIWVNKAHEYIASVYGDDWKDKYVVWDPAWGTGNLTRDHKFKELYASTLNYSDIQTADQMGYNTEAVKFQFDFLNDDYDFLPNGLREAIESGKEMLFLFNPPYATAGVTGNNSEHKEGVAKTKMNKLMVKEGWGKSSQNLYSQFFYRLTKLQEINKKIKIAVFCKPLYLTGDAYGDFRNKFFNHFGYEKGFLFEASNFSDVAKGWGINFAIFSEKTNDVKKSFIHDLIKKDGDLIKNGDEEKLITYGLKTLYNTDGLKQASKWVREELKGLKTFDAPQISSATIVKENGNCKLVQDSLGYFYSSNNNVAKNSQNVSMFTSAFSDAHGLSVIKENFGKCVNLFAGRKMISNDWINDKDEYLAPNENHEYYQQFTNDSVVYSLFNNSSQQSSLRQISYKDRLWDIKNEFFWMSKEEMMELANHNNYNELYSDARTDNNRYVYNLLFGEPNIYNQLSLDAKLVLDKAIELVRLSMNMRSHFADNHNHLNSWDAGYAQLKLVWKEYFSEEFKEFRQLYKNLEDRMRPLVYELGFLLK
jgi:hypothetical protein